MLIYSVTEFVVLMVTNLLLNGTFSTLAAKEKMSANSSAISVYTELDEQRFNLWLGRLEASYKVSLKMTYLALIFLILISLVFPLFWPRTMLK